MAQHRVFKVKNLTIIAANQRALATDWNPQFPHQATYIWAPPNPHQRGLQNICRGTPAIPLISAKESVKFYQTRFKSGWRHRDLKLQEQFMNGDLSAIKYAAALETAGFPVPTEVFSKLLRIRRPSTVIVDPDIAAQLIEYIGGKMKDN